MTPKEIQEIKEKIDSEKEKTQKEISDYKELTKPIAPDCAIGRVSRMDAINNKAIYDNALRKAENKLRNLEYVITQLEKSDFGLCAKCNSKIPIQRIIIMPQSRLCVNCVSR